MSNQQVGMFRRRPDRGGGQTLVEFALILPLFMVLLMGIIEFAFMFNATLSINFTSRDASLIAAEAGIQSTADCAVLAKVEQDVAAPLNDSNIQSVTIYKADRFGQGVHGQQRGQQRVHERSGQHHLRRIHAEPRCRTALAPTHTRWARLHRAVSAATSSPDAPPRSRSIRSGLRSCTATTS
jgi:hypothetical protein